MDGSPKFWIDGWRSSKKELMMDIAALLDRCASSLTKDELEIRRQLIVEEYAAEVPIDPSTLCRQYQDEAEIVAACAAAHWA
jgi:hypothetical protein